MLSGVGRGCEQRQRCLRGQAFNNDYKLELAAGATGCSCGPAGLWSAPRLLQGPRPPCMRRRWNYVAACGKECHATPGWRSAGWLKGGWLGWCFWWTCGSNAGDRLGWHTGMRAREKGCVHVLLCLWLVLWGHKKWSIHKDNSKKTQRHWL